jgi:hypothetical protein
MPTTLPTFEQTFGSPVDNRDVKGPVDYSIS